jgi:hypothetical protein
VKKEYFLEIREGVIVFVQFNTEKGDVKDFVVKLLCEFRGKWHKVLRYDSGHRCPHKDILDITGGVIRKVWYDFLDNSQALTMAIADIKDNYKFYRERYLKWLKGN